jgi:uncharacterized protein YbjT (DUF2867 family)
MRIIITGATGIAGEGVLLECLENPAVLRILMINRRSSPIRHPKLTELLVPDFTRLSEFKDQLRGYDACFFCAGISSVGMNENKYHYITYETTMAFAQALLEVNSQMTFCYISGSHTDSSEKGRIMWARVKGKTENALMRLPFKAVYNFRPGGMLPAKGQKNTKWIYVVIVKMILLFSKKYILTLNELGRAMIHSGSRGYDKQVLEVSDIKKLATN